MHKKQGLFIVFEGQDGAGKSTQIEALAAFLRDAGRDVVLTREPGGTPIAEKIRQVLLDRENAGMSAACEAYLYAAARAEHVDKVIVPALQRGAVVLCDRFMLSSVAYQGYGRGLGAEQIRKLNALALKGVKPDCTFYLSLDPQLGLSRIAARQADRIEMENLDFHTRVREGYLSAASNDISVHILDARQAPEPVTRRMLEIFSGLYAAKL